MKDEIKSQMTLEDWIGTRDNKELNVDRLVTRRNDFTY